MNCANHTDVSAVAYCRTCGKPLCANCKRDVRGVIYCENCLASHIGTAFPAAAATAAPGGSTTPIGENRLPSPGMAAALGFIPGVGAMYNGQFMKGFIHVMAFVCIIWMAGRYGPIMVPVFFAYFFYLVFDAYKTAHAIELGQPVPDPFGLERAFGGGSTHYPPRPTAGAAASAPVAGGAPAAGVVPVADSSACCDTPGGSRAPVGAAVLIILGVLFLLNNLEVLEFHWMDRMWPLILVVIGGWLFYKRWNR